MLESPRIDRQHTNDSGVDDEAETTPPSRLPRR